MDVKPATKPSVQPASPPKPVESSQSAEHRKADTPKPPPAQKARAEQPRPVVNTQGQTIGTRLNVTA